MRVEDQVRSAAREEGFDAVGLARLESLVGTEEGARLSRFVEEGAHGTMEWLARTVDRRLDPAEVLPGARTAVVVGMTTWWPTVEREAGAGEGLVARYARGRDYHKVFVGRLRSLERRLAELFPGAGLKHYVDTGPVLEKLWAERAGVGWRGKHTNLVSRVHGSWLLLGVVLTDVALEADAPHVDRCGSCTRCLSACPTDAFPAPYRLDARRCLSYLTIEHRGAIPVEFRRPLGGRVFGCDDCLEVCPWNRFARASREMDFEPRGATLGPLLAELVSMTAGEFVERFAGTPVMRAGRDGLARNAAVALGNTGVASEAVPVLVRALSDGSGLVREHAAWGLGRVWERTGSAEALAALREALGSEDAGVVEEAARFVEGGGV